MPESAQTLANYIWKTNKITLEHFYHINHYDDMDYSKIVEIHKLTFYKNDFDSILGEIEKLILTNSYDDFKPDKK